MSNPDFVIDENENIDHDAVWHETYDDDDEFRQSEAVTPWWATYEFYSKQENKSGCSEE